MPLQGYRVTCGNLESDNRQGLLFVHLVVFDYFLVSNKFVVADDWLECVNHPGFFLACAAYLLDSGRVVTLEERSEQRTEHSVTEVALDNDLVNVVLLSHHG